jgi:hypothetical protein
MRARRCALVVVGLALAACTQSRGLKISEIGAGRVELYLNEPNTNALDLGGQTLDWQAVDPSGTNLSHSGSIDLGGSLDGEQFFVVFEQPGHTGVPTTEFYNNFNNQSVKGLEVAPTTLGPVDPALAYAFRVHGRQLRYIFPIFYTYDETDDTVRFGPRGRPNIGGTFTEDYSLDPVIRTQAVGLTKGRTIRRKTTQIGTLDTPADRDLEADWQTDDESYGKPK